VKLYLMRHATPEANSDGPERALSELGLTEATKVADFVGQGNKVKVKVSLHSGKLRARQTADIIASRLDPAPRVMEGNGLDPNADPEVWIDRAITMEESALLVGHLPHLSRLTSCLLNRDESKETVDFPAAALVCLSRHEEGKFLLDWKLIPELL
jgi:phosphohistidine phosphatase